jgi:hypothetical protein
MRSKYNVLFFDVSIPMIISTEEPVNSNTKRSHSLSVGLKIVS